MRVYLPATLPQLGKLIATGALPCVAGWAATSGPRPTGAAGTVDDEEREYAAFSAAAQASLALLAEEPVAPRRRIVISAEVPDASVLEFSGPESAGWDPPEEGTAAVVLAEPVELPQVAAVHADESAASAVVSAAISGDPAAALRLADVPLLWWARQEIADVLEAAGFAAGE